VRAERDDVALPDRDVEARNACSVGARPHDRAARRALEREVATRVIGVVMRVEDVREAPPRGVELRQDLVRVGRVDGGRGARLRVVQQIAVVVG